jgi:hypothetical protein
MLLQLSSAISSISASLFPEKHCEDWSSSAYDDASALAQANA